MSINELLQSVKVNLYDKATSPLFGIFLFAWVSWNYKFLIILTSGLKPHDKFNYIETHIYCDKIDFLVNGILPPLGIALAFIFIYPYPAREVYKFYRKRQNELLTIKKETGETKPISKVEARII